MVLSKHTKVEVFFNVNRPLFTIPNGSCVMTKDGMVPLVRKNSEQRLTEYVFECYAGTYKITCDKHTLLLTEEGFVPVSSIKEGAVLVVRGKWVFDKMTKIKKIFRYHSVTRDGYWVKSKKEFFSNGLILTSDGE